MAPLTHAPSTVQFSSTSGGAIRAKWRSSGHRRRRPAKLHVDKAYDIPRCRRALTQRHTKVRIARKGVESSVRLGRHRWVVERMLAWLAHFLAADGALRTASGYP